MKAEHVNAFIKAGIEVLNNFAPSKFRVGKPFERVAPFDAQEYVILLGIIGDIRGSATLGFSEDVARQIASDMMMGMPVTVIDDMAKSALSELGNMVMGNAATLLFNVGTKVDITPPSLVRGHALEVSTCNRRVLCVPLVSDIGTIDFDISIQE